MNSKKADLRITIAYWVINVAIVCFVALFIWGLTYTISTYLEIWEMHKKMTLNFPDLEIGIITQLIGTIAHVLFLMVLFSIRKFLIQFRKAEYFGTDTIKSLKKISFGLLLYIITNALGRTIIFNTMTDAYGNEVPVPIAFYASLTFLAIFIWLVLPAFFAGRELKNETDLTV